jgi:hypothetical protein
MTDETPEEESFSDRIQRAMNEGKKHELNERYGMNLDAYHSNLPLDAEAEWLNNIEQFEKQFEHSKRIPVREVIGDPPITPLAEIADEDVEAMLAMLLKLLNSHFISVDFIFDVAAKEAYRFITEELLDHEMDDIRIPGMFSCFIYEEFHPCDLEDVKRWAKDFLYDLFARDAETEIEGFEISKETRFISLGDEELYDSAGKATTRAQYEENIDKFHERYRIIMAFSLVVESSTVEGDYGTAIIDTTWEALDTAIQQITLHTGKSHLRLKRSPYGGWDVIQANVVGIECL